MITEKFQKLNDIDWFCILDGTPIHVASAGDLLPDMYADYKSVAFMKSILKSILTLPLVFCYKLNDNYLDNHVLNEGYEYLGEHDNPIGQDMDDDWLNIMTHNEPLPKKLYSTSFVEMARRGFYSFDKTENKEGEYHLVAYPLNGTIDVQSIDVPYVENANLDFTNPYSLVNIRLVELINQSHERSPLTRGSRAQRGHRDRFR